MRMVSSNDMDESYVTRGMCIPPSGIQSGTARIIYMVYMMIENTECDFADVHI